MGKKILPSLKVQFTVIVFVIMIVFIILNIITGNLISNLVSKKNIQYSTAISQKLVRELNYTYKQIDAASNILQFESRLQKYFQEDMDIETIENVEKQISDIKLFYNDIFDIALVGKKYVNSICLQKDTLNEIIAQEKDNTKFKCAGLYVHNYFDNDITTLAFNCKVFDMGIGDNYGERLGDIVISVNVDTLFDNFKQQAEGISFVIFDEQGKYYPINCSQEQGKDIIDTIGNFHDTQYRIEDDKNIIVIEPIKNMNLYVVSSIDKSFSRKDITYILSILIIIYSLFIILLCIVFTIIYKNTIKPIRVIGDYLKTIKSGNYKKLKERVVVGGNKEVVELADDLNNMTEEINQLTHKLINTTEYLYEVEIEKKRAEISYLRSQINPHFLYNALETIKGIAMSNDLPQISSMAQCLGDIFRYCIKGSSEVILAEELKMIKAYIDIQKIKFCNKVNIFYNINDDTLNALMPKMILQPIVENAFVHAIEKNTDCTILYIGTKVEDKSLIITIQDDGIGIDRDVLDRIIDSLDSDNNFSSNHVGIANVHKRIKMIYGKEYGVKIDSTDGEGTKIDLILPYKI